MGINEAAKVINFVKTFFEGKRKVNREIQKT